MRLERQGGNHHAPPTETHRRAAHRCCYHKSGKHDCASVLTPLKTMAHISNRATSTQNVYTEWDQIGSPRQRTPQFRTKPLSVPCAYVGGCKQTRNRISIAQTFGAIANVREQKAGKQTQQSRSTVTRRQRHARTTAADVPAHVPVTARLV